MEELKLFLKDETKRQNEGLELIASENFTSVKVRELCGSILTNKYAEGFPGKRYYGGCQNIDKIEQLAIDLACKLFGSKFANVQPHSGSSANMIAYAALLNPGDTILSLSLDEGGHLTHGSPVSFSSKYYKIQHYHLNAQGRIDYEGLAQIAKDTKPQLILAGFSAYPYEIDFKRISEIAKENGAYFMVDMAHIAGLIAAGYHPSPVPYADVVTSTTHKTLRGPRGGLILCNTEEMNKKVNFACFPGHQGGPLENIIAAKAQCFLEALSPEYKEYIKGVVENTKACAERFQELGAHVSGTQTHLFLVDTKRSYGMTGYDAQHILEDALITLNKNMIPGDTEKPSKTSGVRIGFAALTTRGCTVEIARSVADIIHAVLAGQISAEVAKRRVRRISSKLKDVTTL